MYRYESIVCDHQSTFHGGLTFDIPVKWALILREKITQKIYVNTKYTFPTIHALVRTKYHSSMYMHISTQKTNLREGYDASIMDDIRLLGGFHPRETITHTDVFHHSGIHRSLAVFAVSQSPVTTTGNCTSPLGLRPNISRYAFHKNLYPLPVSLRGPRAAPDRMLLSRI